MTPDALTPLDSALLARTLTLARLGGRAVSPNPQVGAVLAVGERIIAEGWHQRYGGPHAEVNCLAQVEHIPAGATLYVSLEPCSHHGQTPPCADLILARGLRRVVVGCADPNPVVAGRGLERLRSAGVQVLLAPKSAPYRELIRPFTVRVLQGRPYVVLKWAQTADGKMGRSTGGRLRITGVEAQHYTHALRARAHAVLVGWRTVLADRPRLNTRHAATLGAPRVGVFDPSARLSPAELATLADPDPIIITGRAPLREQLTALLREHRVGQVLVEGGGATLQRFIDERLWDEIHVLLGPHPAPDADLLAPALPAADWQALVLGPDRLLRTFAPESLD